MGILLIVPIILLRYGLMRILNKTVMPLALIFPQGKGNEGWKTRLNEWIINGLVFSPLFAGIHGNAMGWAVYGLGLFVLAAAVAGFARRNERGFCDTGIYAWSRNPMILGYVLSFAGAGLVFNAWFYWIFFIPFVLTLPAVIRAEEAWCRREFGQPYEQYLNRTRSYFGKK